MHRQSRVRDACLAMPRCNAGELATLRGRRLERGRVRRKFACTCIRDSMMSAKHGDFILAVVVVEMGSRLKA